MYKKHYRNPAAISQLKRNKINKLIVDAAVACIHQSGDDLSPKDAVHAVLYLAGPIEQLHPQAVVLWESYSKGKTRLLNKIAAVV